MSSDVLFNKISKFYQSNQNCQKYKKLLHDTTIQSKIVRNIVFGRKSNFNIIQSKVIESSSTYSLNICKMNVMRLGYSDGVF